MSEQPRCDQCRFWVFSEQQGGEPQDHLHEDDRTGTCHRNAPRVSLGGFEHHVLTALWLLLPKNEAFNETWEECISSGLTEWPETMAHEWCGEFKAKLEPS
jgi:hypothetical protein